MKTPPGHPPLLEEKPLTLTQRVWLAARLLLGLRGHDFQAARTLLRQNFSDGSLPRRLGGFIRWGLHQTFCVIPDAMRYVTESEPIDRTPIWLAEGNPLADYPWTDRPSTQLPHTAEVVVIGAGFTGAAMAYHWSKTEAADQRIVVLEMDDPASGASGRNEGLVVMGRYFAMVHNTVSKYLHHVRTDLSPPEHDQLARQFSTVYCRAAYKNADMIEQTIQVESLDCDYARAGWVQTREGPEQSALQASVNMATETGCDDWTQITPQQVADKTGMRTDHNAGYSKAAGSFHPAKWVWSLFKTALKNDNVELYTRTKVLRVDDVGDSYVISTPRGEIRARHVVNATESYTPLLHRQFHQLILPIQTQAAYGQGGPEAIKPHVGISGSLFFAGKHGSGVMAGTDATPVPDRCAGRNRPSRFLTRFVMGQLRRYYGPFQMHLTHEWSGTVGYTPDEFPIVGPLDGRRQYIIAGMAGSGTAVSFNAARWTCDQILGIDGDDDYPAEYFSPTRLLNPDQHRWPKIEMNSEIANEAVAAGG